MKTGLLIVDIQNDYFPGGKMELAGAEDAGKKAGLALKDFRDSKLPVFYIQHISLRPGSTFFLPGTLGMEINDCVKPNKNEMIIQKNLPNSFLKTTLLDELRKAEVKNLVICGMMTHMCVDATTRAAFDLGFQCTLLYDACATRDLVFQDKRIKADLVHYAFISALNGIYAKSISVEEYLRSPK